MSAPEFVLRWREEPYFIDRIIVFADAFAANTKQLKELKLADKTDAGEAASALRRLFISRAPEENDFFDACQYFFSNCSDQELHFFSRMTNIINRQDYKFAGHLIFWHASNIAELTLYSRRLLSKKYHKKCAKICDSYIKIIADFSDTSSIKNKWDDVIEKRLLPNNAWWTEEASIVFVHGTFGRGFLPKSSRLSYERESKRWFEAGSPFQDRLTQALTDRRIKIASSAFLWSGWNTVSARKTAGTALKERLTQMLLDDPNRRILIIGHSHGGNVALIAASNLESKTNFVQIATMATPFLEVYENISSYIAYRYIWLYSPFILFTIVYAIYTFIGKNLQTLSIGKNYLCLIAFALFLLSLYKVLFSIAFSKKKSGDSH